MLNDLVDKIYEAAFVPDSWVDALEAVAGASESASGTIFVFNEGRPPRGRSTLNVQAELDAFIAGDSWRKSDSVQSMYKLQPAAFVQVDDFLTAEVPISLAARLTLLRLLAQAGKDIAEPGGAVGLEVRRAKITQHRVVAGLVGLVECQQRIPRQDQHAIAVDIGGPSRLLPDPLLLGLPMGGQRPKDRRQRQKSAGDDRPPPKTV
ncbi:hypothetical protein [Mesorhizobium sp. BR1-1-13]|uniref:hypothetical protein n=1 Tax=unclassified Mesorhizobium TaxID=325217 RepID=UPI00398CEA3A